MASMLIVGRQTWDGQLVLGNLWPTRARALRQASAPSHLRFSCFFLERTSELELGLANSSPNADFPSFSRRFVTLSL